VGGGGRGGGGGGGGGAVASKTNMLKLAWTPDEIITKC